MQSISDGPCRSLTAKRPTGQKKKLMMSESVQMNEVMNVKTWWLFGGVMWWCWDRGPCHVWQLADVWSSSPMAVMLERTGTRTVGTRSKWTHFISVFLNLPKLGFDSFTSFRHDGGVLVGGPQHALKHQLLSDSESGCSFEKGRFINPLSCLNRCCQSKAEHNTLARLACGLWRCGHVKDSVATLNIYESLR